MNTLEKIREYFKDQHNYAAQITRKEFAEIVEQAKAEAREIITEGWQGKDKIDISKVGTDWIIKEHRKEKHSKEIAQQTHIIPEVNVANLWIMIKDRTPNVGNKTTSRDLASDIILKHRLKIGVSEMWGGENRHKYYFPLLYYCLKILEKTGHIKYGARGDVTRLR